jgi:flavin reductase (DIM6/NTAB) family NADH-FMN oxidoreductase RutF
MESVFQLIDREVWIVTAASPTARGGLLASWVMQTSLDPVKPMVAAGIASNHFTAELIDAACSFGLHLIGADQAALALRFALESGRDFDKLAGLKLLSSASGAPILADCIAWLDCRVLTCFDTGDRRYYWADITDADIRRPSVAPMRESQLFAAASEEQRGALRASRDRDIGVQTPLAERWRHTITNPND